MDNRIIFRKGEYEFHAEGATVKVHIPHDVTVSQIKPAIGSIAKAKRSREASHEIRHEAA